jgi:flagellar protein FlaF
VNATLRAQDAYRRQTQAIRTERGIEYDAFAQITHRLQATALLGPSGFGALASALHANRRLWTTLVTDVADRNNPLPPEVKARIVYLSEFTRLHSSKVLRGEGAVDPLIEINSAIMRGLRDASRDT